MTALALFCLLAGLSGFTVLRGLRHKEGVFQFPVLFAGAFAFSIVPQLVNHVFYPGRLPEKVYRDHGVEYGILMCILCLLCGIAGYSKRPINAPRRPRWVPNVRADKLFWAGLILCGIGFCGAAKLTGLAGGWQARFTEGGHYAMAWSGAPVLWTYVAKLLPFGLVLCLNSALIRGNVLKWSFVVLVMLYPLATIVFLGRRSTLAGFVAILAVSLWFRHRWAPPRLLSIGAMVLAGVLVVLLPQYRTYANRTGDVRAAIAQVDATDTIEAYLHGERQEGADNLIIGIPAQLAYPSYGFGSGLWNGAVAYLVPGQIVGYDLKEALVLPLGATPDLFSRYCGVSPEFDSFSTGPYSVFAEFSFLGCLVYYLVGRSYRLLWHLASERRHLGVQVLYVSLAIFAPMSVINSITAVFPQFLLAIAILGSTLWIVGERHDASSAFHRVSPRDELQKELINDVRLCHRDSLNDSRSGSRG